MDAVVEPPPDCNIGEILLGRGQTRVGREHQVVHEEGGDLDRRW